MSGTPGRFRSAVVTAAWTASLHSYLGSSAAYPTQTDESLQTDTSEIGKEFWARGGSSNDGVRANGGLVGRRARPSPTRSGAGRYAGLPTTAIRLGRESDHDSERAANVPAVSVLLNRVLQCIGVLEHDHNREIVPSADVLRNQYPEGTPG